MMYDTGTTCPFSITGGLDIVGDSVTTSPMSITATRDTQTNTPLPPPTLAEIIDMLFEARRTIEAQDKLIASLQQSEEIWAEEHTELDRERYRLQEELQTLRDKYDTLEKDYETLERDYQKVRG